MPFCPGKTPSDEEVRSCVRRMVQRVRTHWPDTRINVRGNRHYGRPEVMAWCEASGLTYVFGLAGNSMLDRMVGVIADDLRGRRAEAHPDVVRMQLVDSVIRAPILIRCIWMVLNSARASGRICRMASSAGGAAAGAPGWRAVSGSWCSPSEAGSCAAAIASYSPWALQPSWLVTT